MSPNDTDALTVTRLTEEQTTLNAVPEKDRTPAQNARLVAIADELKAIERLAHSPTRP